MLTVAGNVLVDDSIPFMVVIVTSVVAPVAVAAAIELNVVDDTANVAAVDIRTVQQRKQGQQQQHHQQQQQQQHQRQQRYRHQQQQ